MDWDTPKDTAAPEWDAAGGDDYEANASKHAQGGFDAAGDDTCRNCGETGHFARECEKPKQMGACFKCGETGHNKADCPNAEVFTGTCNICNKPNHKASECPDRGPVLCKNCNQEGHKTIECTNNRAAYLANVRTETPEKAWEAIKAADEIGDLFGVREAVKVYAKAVPDTTFLQLERAFRNQSFKTYIIALEVQESKPHTIVNLQGIVNCKYVVQFAKSQQPKRTVTAHTWPPSAEVNMQRLESAGFMEDRHLSKCINCGELGHVAKFCKEDKREIEHVKVKCFNCGEEGHRTRDCPQERVDPNVCRNCKKPGHRSNECEEPRSAEGVECKRCSQMGHFAKDCPNSTGGDRTCRNCGKEGHMAKDCEEPRNNANMTCRNCDEVGHSSRECPKPRDYSRVTCRNCGETGHTVVRCKAAPKDDGDEAGAGPTGWENAGDTTGWNTAETTDTAIGW